MKFFLGMDFGIKIVVWWKLWFGKVNVGVFGVGVWIWFYYVDEGRVGVFRVWVEVWWSFGF